MQSYTGSMHWVVVDDCEPASPIRKMSPRITVEKIRPAWRWNGVNTQAACMAAGLARIPDDATVLVLEDDDAYLPGHIENIVNALESYELVGERTSKCYNIRSGRYRTLTGGQHASMASVGLRGNALTALKTICGAGKTALDVKLWRSFKGPKTLLNTQNVIGMKGLPGRAGIGVGHRATFGDPDTRHVLEEWLGPERAVVYQQFRRVS
jgi:hypothetical protein